LIPALRHFVQAMLIFLQEQQQLLRLLMTPDSLELFNKIMIFLNLLKLLTLRSKIDLPPLSDLPQLIAFISGLVC
jgi:hypothetical protein